MQIQGYCHFYTTVKLTNVDSSSSMLLITFLTQKLNNWTLKEKLTYGASHDWLWWLQPGWFKVLDFITCVKVQTLLVKYNSNMNLYS